MREDQPGDHLAVRAIQRMVEFAPSTGGLALWVQHRDVDDAAAPTVIGCEPRLLKITSKIVANDVSPALFETEPRA